MSHSWAFFKFLINNSTVSNPIFSDLAHPALRSFSGTCREAKIAVHGYNLRTYNINRHLSRWFSDPIAFRSLQARTGAVISGSSALQFFDRTLYVDADLDLFVERDFSKLVGEWLLCNGYVYVTGKDGKEFSASAKDALNPLDPHYIEHYDISGVSKVFTFLKSGDPSLRVQVVCTRNSVMEVILKFHSTCVMNLITSLNAFSLYPRATFQDRTSLVLPAQGIKSLHGIAVEKYRSRGWEMISDVDRAETGSSRLKNFLINGEYRWVGDEYTWTIPLPQDGVECPGESSLRVYMHSPVTPGRMSSSPGQGLKRWDCATINSWLLHVSYFGPQPSVEFKDYTKSVFRYHYTLSRGQLPVQVVDLVAEWEDLGRNRYHSKDPKTRDLQLCRLIESGRVFFKLRSEMYVTRHAA